MPKFEERDWRTFSVWVSDNINYPKDLYESSDVIKVSFVIEKDGRLSNARILRSTNDKLNEPVVFALLSSPRWRPGRIDGKPVRSILEMPVYFHLGSVPPGHRLNTHGGEYTPAQIQLIPQNLHLP